MNILEQIQKKLLTHIQQTYNLSPDTLTSLSQSLTTDEAKNAFGDITSNAPLVLAKIVHKSPRDIADELSKNFSDQYIDSITIAGPGFLNIRLSIDAFKELLTQMYEQQKDFFKNDTDAPRTSYSLEFVSANPTGPLHLGHGRGGIIGDVLGNILRFIGHHATKEFYINDAGAQIAKLGKSFKIRCMQQLGQHVEIPEDGYHGEYLIALAQQVVKKEGAAVLEKPDSFLEDYAKNHLLELLKKTLLEYGIEYDVWFSEKSLHDDGQVSKAIDILIARGFTYEADGALWFKSTEFGDDKDRVLRKSTGEWTYISSDVAYLHNKITRGAEHLVMVLGQDHHSYVVRLKAIMVALGYRADQIDVILYQLVTLKESGEQVRMSKRAGRIVSLEDVIKTVGRDVARFFYLQRKADAHLEFDLDLALKHTDENPVYYLQYAYVRTGSIIEKASLHPELEALTNADCHNIGSSEVLILKKIASLKELLHSISFNYQTHLLTYYVMELAHMFHKYYSDNRVIDLANVSQSRGRLMVVTMLRSTLETCFQLMEISQPKRM